MSKDLFESLRPYIQGMIDAHVPGTGGTVDTPPVVGDVSSVVMMQDNVTGKWHRVFLWNNVLYMELRDANAPVTQPINPVKPPDNGINPPLSSGKTGIDIDLIPIV